MPIIDDLPSQQDFSDVINRLIGSEGDGVSLSAAMGVLNNINPDSISVSVGGKLSGHVSASINVDTDELFGDALSQIQNTIKSIPGSGEEVLVPILQVIEQLENLLKGDFDGTLSELFEGFNQIQNILPASGSNILSPATDGIDNLLSEFSGGAFSDVKAWSEMVANFGTEVSAIISAGPDGLIERLIAFLSTHVAALLKSIMPHPDGPSADLTLQFVDILDFEKISNIAALFSAHIANLNAVQLQFESADFTTTSNTQAAVDSFNDLISAFTSIIDEIEQALNVPAATLPGLTELMSKKYTELADMEAVDIADVRQYLVDAINRLGNLVDGLGLDDARDTIDQIFDDINGVISSAKLDQIESFLQDFSTQIESVSALLDGQLLMAVASIRNIFTQMQTSVNGLLGNLGTVDGGGDFQYAFQQDLDDYLSGISDTLANTVQPLINDFETTITNALQSFTTILSDLQDEIAAVKNDLENLLQGVEDTLDSADVPAVLESMAARLEEMLAQLGDLSFNPVIEEVVDEIDGMTEQLRQIDVSSMSEITVGALKVSVEVVTNIEFSSQISQVLIEQLDNIMELPKQGISEVQKSVEYTVDQFSKLKPELLLKELDQLIAPLQTVFDDLNPERLLKPLTDWHADLVTELEKLSLDVLLKPVTELHGDLVNGVEQVAPSQLIEPLQKSVDKLQADIDNISLDVVRSQFTNAQTSLTSALDSLAPTKLLQPVLEPFSTLETTLNGFRPSQLLQPVNDFFDSLTVPLDAINQSQVDAISLALAPLKQLNTAFDPAINFTGLSTLFDQILAFLDQLNFGAKLSEINGIYGNANLAFDSDVANVNVSASFRTLNPLQNTNFTALSTRTQNLRSRLQTEFSNATVPSTLTTGYAEIEDTLATLAPSWLVPDLTPQGLRAAIQLANPLNIGTELDLLYDDVLSQIMAFNPTQLVVPLQSTYDTLVANVGGLSLDPVLDALENSINGVTGALSQLDPSILTTELDSLFDEIMSMVEALDPSTILAELQGVIDTLAALVDSLDPAELIAGVDGPLTAAKDIAAEINIGVFTEPLNTIFDQVTEILEQVDVAVVLEPVTDRLDDLQVELEEGLVKTEKSFVNMLNAIPV